MERSLVPADAGGGDVGAEEALKQEVCGHLTLRSSGAPQVRRLFDVGRASGRDVPAALQKTIVAAIGPIVSAERTEEYGLSTGQSVRRGGGRCRYRVGRGEDDRQVTLVDCRHQLPVYISGWGHAPCTLTVPRGQKDG
jgi:hypothetical protein